MVWRRVAWPWRALVLRGMDAGLGTSREGIVGAGSLDDWGRLWGEALGVDAHMLLGSISKILEDVFVG